MCGFLFFSKEETMNDHQALTAAQAAAHLGVSRSRIYTLIKEGRLPAEKWGRDYLILAGDLKRVKARQPGGSKRIYRKVPANMTLREYKQFIRDTVKDLTGETRDDLTPAEWKRDWQEYLAKS
jgi:excisionase family DNA binding protein